MGTRGLIGHVIAGKKKGTYNGHDSYPSWLGVAIVQFIKSLSAENIKTMKEHLEEITWIDRCTGDLRSELEGVTSLKAIFRGCYERVVDEAQFANHRNFCEWVYWIDWDQERLEVCGPDHTGAISLDLAFGECDESRMMQLNEGHAKVVMMQEAEAELQSVRA